MYNRIFYGAIFLLLAGVIAFGGSALGQGTTPAASSENEPLRTISVSGSGQASLTPDVAYIFIGVQTENKDASEAVSANSTRANRIMDALRRSGIAARDIRTSNFSIYPQTQYDNQGRPTGEITYIVNNTVNVTVRDINRVGSVLDSAVEAGANSINGIQFDVIDRTAATSQARQAAVANARAVAEEVAAAAGVQLGEVQTINVHGGGYSVPVYGRAAQDAAESIPVSPGEMTISVEVSIVYAIR
jgi:uncharacterized protein